DMGAVAEAARNVACTGAVPMAITNCLNFGSPLKTHIMYQFREAVLGMRDACAHFETPVTGGNVSFYNETDGKAVYPTPVIGMIGVIGNLDTIVRHAFRDAGDAIFLLGTNTGELGGSEYLYAVHDLVAGEPPGVDLAAERTLHRCVLAMAASRVLSSAHDVASGGLAATLTESCLGGPRMGGGVGAAVRFEDALPDTALLFGEDQGRVVVSCAPGDEEQVRRLAVDFGVPCTRIGTVTGAGSALRIETVSSALRLELDVLRERYFGAIPGIMNEAG
ncbi:MAG: AIR synthase related protein, partial [Gemmatimonadota bacterium]|nr:AIR synthase related protein [Gemmatimonadota bacterium]